MTDRGQAVGFRHGDGSCDGRSIPPQEKWGAMCCLLSKLGGDQYLDLDDDCVP